MRIAKDEVYHFLNQVDQEEARADDEVREELYAEFLSWLGELLADLREDVEHCGGQEHAAAQTQQERGDQPLGPARLTAPEAKTLTANMSLQKRREIENRLRTSRESLKDQ